MTGCPVLTELAVREDYGDEENPPVLSGGDYDISAIRNCAANCVAGEWLARAAKALEWYGEQAQLCHVIHSDGGAGHAVLVADGGVRASALLRELRRET